MSHNYNNCFLIRCSRLIIWSLKPIFHWVPNANEIYTKTMKYTWPTPAFCIGTQRNLYSTDWRRGLASGLTQILGLASGVWRRVMQIFTFLIPTCWYPQRKILASRALPNATPRCQVVCVLVEYRLMSLV